jgi:hypothetical protein
MSALRGKADLASYGARSAYDPQRTFNLARASLKQCLRAGGVYGQKWSILYRCALGIGASLRIAGRPQRRLCPTPAVGLGWNCSIRTPSSTACDSPPTCSHSPKGVLE